MDDRELLSLSEAAERYNIPLPTLRSAVQTGNIVARKVGHQWVVNPKHVEAYLANRPRRGRPAKKKD
jgi:excisionase family DNA binding protein